MLDPVTIAACTVPFANISTDLIGTLRTIGVAIVPDVLTGAEVAAAEALFSQDLRSIVNLSDEEFAKSELGALKDLPRQWPCDQHAFSVGRKVRGFASDYGLAHGRCAWFCRQNAKIRSVFAAIFDTDDLVVGTDNLFFNTEASPATPDATRVERMWPHADQSQYVKDSGSWEVYQSVLYLWPANQDTSATVVWPGSHQTVYPAMMAAGSASRFNKHFCQLPPNKRGEFAASAGRVPVPSGGLLIWSSRTIHQGWSLGPRLAVPLCFEPRRRRDKDAYARKLQCAKDGTPTTHWASLGIPHVVCSKSNGGTAAVPLFTNAHQWLLDAEGNVIRSVSALL